MSGRKKRRPYGAGHSEDTTRTARRKTDDGVEWDDSDESDEESDLLIDPEDENYHITVDEEQGEGPIPDEPKRSVAHRARIVGEANLKVETEEVKPDYDIKPTREWFGTREDTLKTTGGCSSDWGHGKIHWRQPADHGSLLT
eukprot:1185911-Prorocentrum_minimum.AAC.3